jgi:two-component system LytT family response regulator
VLAHNAAVPGSTAPPEMSWASAGPISKLLVSERGVTRVVPVADIQWLETADNYVVLHTASSQPLLRQTLSALLDNLGPGFVRCHRRAAVQLAWIERVVAQGKGDYALVLKGGASVPCSRQFSASLLERLASA